MYTAEYLFQHRYSESTAITCKDKEISYCELNNKSFACSKMLTVSENTIIGLFIPNSVEYFMGYFGILFAKKEVLLFNIGLKIDEINNIARCAKMKTIFSVSSQKEKLDKIDKEISIVYIDEITLCNFSDLEKLDFSDVDENKGTLIFPTSGTTGNSKLVKISSKNLQVNIDALIKLYKVKKDDNELIVLPLFSSFANIVMLNCLNAGASIFIYTGTFTTKNYIRMVNEKKIRYCSMVPSLIRSIAATYKTDLFKCESLKRITFGGEKLYYDDFQQIKEKLPDLILYFGYGMTEAGPLITTKTDDDWDYKLDSVGKAIPGVKIKILDEAGNELPPGEQGNIVVYGDNISDGYLNAPMKKINSGWLETGDIGWIDNEDYLYITGRKKNIIISSGQNIFPEEVEEVIKKNSEIKEVKVFSESDEFLGEIVAAQIVVDNKDNFDIKQLKEYCRLHMAEYKIPRKIYFVDYIEKTATNKIKR